MRPMIAEEDEETVLEVLIRNRQELHSWELRPNKILMSQTPDVAQMMLICLGRCKAINILIDIYS